jgi:hypothetical protein
LGDVVAGVGNTALGVVSFGRSGTLARGIGQFGSGVGGIANILVRDTVATIVGVGGTVYTTLRDVANVLTFGNVYSKGNLFSAVKSLVADAVVPEYGMFGGGRAGERLKAGDQARS